MGVRSCAAGAGGRSISETCMGAILAPQPR